MVNPSHPLDQQTHLVDEQRIKQALHPLPTGLRAV